MIELELAVIAVHGEGDRETVNRLQAHRNAANGLSHPADEPPDIMVILRDEAHDFRIEWPVKTWEEAEEWKRLVGFDYEKRHWQRGGKIKVKLGD